MTVIETLTNSQVYRLEDAQAYKESQEEENV